MTVINIEGYINKIPNNFYVSQSTFKNNNEERSAILLLNRNKLLTKEDVFEDIYQKVLNIKPTNEYQEEIESILSHLPPKVNKQLMERKGDYYEALMECIPAPNTGIAQRLFIEYGVANSKLVLQKEVDQEALTDYMKDNTAKGNYLGWIVDMTLNIEGNKLPDKDTIDFLIEEQVTKSMKIYLDIYHDISVRNIKSLVNLIYRSLDSEEKIISVNDITDFEKTNQAIYALRNLQNYHESIKDEDEVKPINRLKGVMEDPESPFSKN